MSDAAHDGRAALRAALAALDAARIAVEAALGDDGETVDLEDRHLWLTIPQAAGVARCSEKTVWRDRYETGVQRGSRWYINRHKLLANRAHRLR